MSRDPSQSTLACKALDIQYWCNVHHDDDVSNDDRYEVETTDAYVDAADDDDEMAE